MAAGIGKIVGRLIFVPGVDDDGARNVVSELADVDRAAYDLGSVEFALDLKAEPVKRTIETSIGTLPAPGPYGGE